MATRRDSLRRRRRTPTTHAAKSAEALEEREAVGGADPEALREAAEQDGATFVRSSPRARAHVRQAPPDAQKRGDALEGVAVPHRVGLPLRVLVGSTDADALEGHWVLIDVRALVTSHDALTFAVAPLYPDGVQERAYHRDLHEQRKVADHAARLVPDFLINTDPTAINGAPVCALDGERRLVVLGGNSRAMSLARAYHYDSAARYRAMLVERAKVFGFVPADVERLDRPALVRVVEAPAERWRDLSRALNEAQTQEKSAADDAVSLSHRVTDTALAILAEHVSPDETLGAFLTSTRARPFVARLVTDRVIRDEAAGALLAGRDLSELGRGLVERTLVAKLLPDAVLIERLGARRRETVARVVPALFDARRYGHDITDGLWAALEDLTDADARGLALEQLEAQESLFSFTRARARSPEALELRSLFAGSPRVTVRALRIFAGLAASEPAGQAGLFGPPRTTSELLVAAIEAARAGEQPRGAAASPSLF